MMWVFQSPLIRVVFIALVAVLLFSFYMKRKKQVDAIAEYSPEEANRGFYGDYSALPLRSNMNVDEAWVESHVKDLVPKLVTYTFAHKVALLETDISDSVIYSLALDSKKLDPESKVDVSEVELIAYNAEASDNTATLNATVRCRVSLTLEPGERHIGILNYNTPHTSEFQLCFSRDLTEYGTVYKLVEFYVTG